MGYVVELDFTCLLFLSQCFAADGCAYAQSDAAAIVFTDVMQVALADAAALEAVFALCFCILGGGDDATC